MDKTRSKTDYRAVYTRDEFDEVLEELRQAKAFGLDLETTGLLGPPYDHIVGWSFSVREGQAWYIPVGHTTGEQLSADEVVQALKPILEDLDKTIVIHNAKYDTRFTVDAGIAISFDHIVDSMLVTFVAAPGPAFRKFGLKLLVKMVWKHDMTEFDDLFPRGTKVKNIGNLMIDLITSYACEDSDYSLRLYNKFYDRVSNSFIHKLEHQLWPYTQKIEDTGVQADEDFLHNMADYVLAEAEKVREIVFQQIAQAVGRRIEFNINSAPQLRDILYNIMGMPITVMTDGGKKSAPQPATSDVAMERLAKSYPVCKNILTYRSMLSNAGKMLGEFAGSILPDGRIHTSYLQTGATSGRYSSTDPNLQNAPKKKEWEVIALDGSKYKVTVIPRDAFVAGEDHYLAELDYSAIEFIIMATEAGETVILVAYERGEDVHANTAAQVLHKQLAEVTEEERNKGKTWNYLIIYGGGAYGLGLRTGQSEEQSEAELRAFFQTFPKLMQFMQRTRDKARITKRVCTHFGRWQWVPEYFENNRRQQAKADRACVNRICQGTAADIQKMGLIRTMKRANRLWTHEQARIVLQTHDSQTWEIHRSIKPQDILPTLMDAMSPEIPNYPRIKVDAKLGVSWGSLHGYDPKVDYAPLFAEWVEQRGARVVAAQREPEEPEQLAACRIIFEPGRALTGADARVIKDVLTQYPGDNVLIVSFEGEEKAIIAYPTSLTLSMAQAVFEPKFPKAKFQIDTRALVDSLAD